MPTRANVRPVRHGISGCLEVHLYASGQIRGSVFASSALTLGPLFLFLNSERKKVLKLKNSPELP